MGAAAPVLPVVSPLVEGGTGRYFEDNRKVPAHRPGIVGGVAAHAPDPYAADHLWDYASSAPAAQESAAAWEPAAGISRRHGSLRRGVHGGMGVQGGEPGAA